MNLYSAIVAVVALWAVVRITQIWLQGRAQSDRADPRQAEIEQLEQRVRTLERLATDQSETLKRKFDDLE